MKVRRRVGGEPGPGGVVGIGDPDHPGALVDQGRHGLQVVAVVARRGDPGGGPHRLGGDGIDGEGVLGEDRLGPGLQKDAGHQIQHIIGAVAEGDGHRATPRDGRRWPGATRSRRHPDSARVRQGRGDGRPRPRAGAQGVLVGGQLDGVADTQFPLQLRDRLAGDIGGADPAIPGAAIGEKGVVWVGHARASGLATGDVTRVTATG